MKGLKTHSQSSTPTATVERNNRKTVNATPMRENSISHSHTSTAQCAQNKRSNYWGNPPSLCSTLYNASSWLIRSTALLWEQQRARPLYSNTIWTVSKYASLHQRINRKLHYNIQLEIYSTLHNHLVTQGTSLSKDCS
jgi:hypothetical protein